MPTQSERDRWFETHPAPERPPNVGSEERDRWKDEIGEDEAKRRMKAWQDWWNEENTFQENAIAEGYGHGDWESILRGLGYEDAHEKGGATFAKFRERNADAERLGYKDWQDMIGQQSWGRIRDTHYGFDPVSGLYVNSPGGVKAGDWDSFDWRDPKTGARVNTPTKHGLGASSAGAGGASQYMGGSYAPANLNAASYEPTLFGVRPAPGTTMRESTGGVSSTSRGGSGTGQVYGSGVNAFGGSYSAGTGGGGVPGVVPYPGVKAEGGEQQRRNPWLML